MNAMGTVTGEGIHRGRKSYHGGPHKPSDGASLLLGNAEAMQCYLIGEWHDQVSKLGKAVRMLLGRNEMKEEASS